MESVSLDSQAEDQLSGVTKETKTIKLWLEPGILPKILQEVGSKLEGWRGKYRLEVGGILLDHGNITLKEVVNFPQDGRAVVRVSAVVEGIFYILKMPEVGSLLYGKIKVKTSQQLTCHMIGGVQVDLFRDPAQWEDLYVGQYVVFQVDEAFYDFNNQLKLIGSMVEPVKTIITGSPSLATESGMNSASTVSQKRRRDDSLESSEEKKRKADKAQSASSASVSSPRKGKRSRKVSGSSDKVVKNKPPKSKEKERKVTAGNKSADGLKDDEDCEEEKALKHPGDLKTPEVQADDVFDVKCKSTLGKFHLSKFTEDGKAQCIEVDGVWMTPKNFEINSGSKAKKYKATLFINKTPLGRFLEDRDIRTPGRGETRSGRLSTLFNNKSEEVKKSDEVEKKMPVDNSCSDGSSDEEEITDKPDIVKRKKGVKKDNPEKKKNDLKVKKVKKSSSSVDDKEVEGKKDGNNSVEDIFKHSDDQSDSSDEESETEGKRKKLETSAQLPNTEKSVVDGDTSSGSGEENSSFLDVTKNQDKSKLRKVMTIDPRCIGGAPPRPIRAKTEKKVNKSSIKTRESSPAATVTQSGETLLEKKSSKKTPTINLKRIKDSIKLSDKDFVNNKKYDEGDEENNSTLNTSSLSSGSVL